MYDCNVNVCFLSCKFNTKVCFSWCSIVTTNIHAATSLENKALS